MQRFGLALAVCLGMFAAGCGSNSSAYSCDLNKNGTHTCVDATISVNSGDVSAFAAAGQTSCTQSGGTSVSSCTRSGAVGGCTTTQSVSSGGTTLTSTTTAWVYSGTAADAMTTCAMAKGTFVSP